MIIVFLILAFLRTLHGIPIPIPTSDSNIDTLMERDDFIRKRDNANTRSEYDLVKSCVLTVLACVWTAAHPNIPGPRDSIWTVFKRRLVMMTCALIAPELMALWALEQWFAARKIADAYNSQVLNPPKEDWYATHDNRLKTENPSLRERLLDSSKSLSVSAKNSLQEMFIELPKARARRGKGQKWTTTHGFFIQMGGFLLYENDYPKQVLDYNALEELIRNKQIDAPVYTEADIHDRSKGDTISKAVVVFQTSWFVIQCIARVCKSLPLSELEVVTLGFALLNAIIYGVWWNKPQGVGLAIFIPLKEKEEQPEPLGNLENADLKSSQTSYEESMDIQNIGAIDAGVAANLQAAHGIERKFASSAGGVNERLTVKTIARTSVYLETNAFIRPENQAVELQKLQEKGNIERSLGNPGESAMRQEIGCDSAEIKSEPSDDGAGTQPRGSEGNDEDAAESSGTPLGHLETDEFIRSKNTPDSVEERTSMLKESWLRRQLHKDRSSHHWLTFAFAWVPIRCGQSLLRPLGKIGESQSIPDGAHRVPMFYRDSRGDTNMTAFASSVIGTVFGAVHLLAWSSAFTSRIELLLWRVFTLIIIVEPISFVITVILADYDYPVAKALTIIIGIPAYVATPLYIIARFTLIVLAFLSLNALPPSDFMTIPWTSFIPHL